MSSTQHTQSADLPAFSSAPTPSAKPAIVPKSVAPEEASTVTSRSPSPKAPAVRRIPFSEYRNRKRVQGFQPKVVPLPATTGGSIAPLLGLAASTATTRVLRRTPPTGPKADRERRVPVSPRIASAAPAAQTPGWPPPKRPPSTATEGGEIDPSRPSSPLTKSVPGQAPGGWEETPKQPRAFKRNGPSATDSASPASSAVSLDDLGGGYRPRGPPSWNRAPDRDEIGEWSGWEQRDRDRDRDWAARTHQPDGSRRSPYQSPELVPENFVYTTTSPPAAIPMREGDIPYSREVEIEPLEGTGSGEARIIVGTRLLTATS